MRIEFVAVILAGFSASTVFGATSPQVLFNSPQQAVQAVAQACQHNSTSSLNKIFGPDGKDIVESGDKRQDKQARKDFLRLEQEKYEVVADSATPDRLTLTIGQIEWPFPVPLVRENGQWRFDSSQGREEIIARRVGANELSAVESCRGYVEAQKSYAENHQANRLPQYAQKIVSDPGQQNGLYWPPTAGAPSCDVPPGFAQAAEGLAADKSQPYHGYFFRVLKGQGSHARGGAASYIDNKGAMTGGFALIARPAEYGVSGVKTFMVASDGVVYQKDLGPDTVKEAQSLSEFNPDPTWQAVDNNP